MCAQMKDLVRIIYINIISSLLILSQIYTEENKVKHGFMLNPMSGHIKVLSPYTIIIRLYINPPYLIDRFQQRQVQHLVAAVQHGN